MENKRNRDSRYSILDAMLEQIAVVDKQGIILFANQSWLSFAQENGMPSSFNFEGASYFHASSKEPEVCERLEAVLKGRLDRFVKEYPCHIPRRQQWFLLQIAPLQNEHLEIEGAIISHINITEGKQLELKLKKLATTDELTKLYNRRFFDQKLLDEVSRLKRYKHPVSLIFVDIDSFKKINDTYGHFAGDTTLQVLAQILRDCTRETDVCARIGGDEFAIILPETGKEEMLKVIERINLTVQQKVIQIEKHRIKLTTSIGGVSSMSIVDSEQTANVNEIVEEMFEKADQALYQSKERGRNCFTIV